MKLIEFYDKFPEDIEDLLIDKFQEKYIFNILFQYVNNPVQKEYLDYVKTLDNNSTHQVINRINKVSEFIIKNNYILTIPRGVEGLLYNNTISSLDVSCISSYYSKKSIPRYGDIFSGFSLKKYNIGDQFRIKVGGLIVGEITLTKENKNNLFLPLFNKYPIMLISLQFTDVLIYCTNRPLDKPIRIYFTLLENKLRMKAASEIHFITVNNKTYKYQAGLLSEIS